MSELPSHILPTYSNASREDALFHYTTANGLIGILDSGEIWSTAYYCANDESELAAGRGVLSPLFRSATHKLIEANDPRVLTFNRRGVDIRDYADQFEGQITGVALNAICAYISCFCKPTNEEKILYMDFSASGEDTVPMVDMRSISVARSCFRRLKMQIKRAD